MKSMSWLLYNSECCIQRECRACGFSTRSPSIYRRHSKRCLAINSLPENTHANGTTTVDLPADTALPDFPSSNIPDICSKSSPVVDLPPKLNSQSAGIPIVSSTASVEFPDISLSLVAEAGTCISSSSTVSNSSTSLAPELDISQSDTNASVSGYIVTSVCSGVCLSDINDNNDACDSDSSCANSGIVKTASHCITKCTSAMPNDASPDSSPLQQHNKLSTVTDLMDSGKLSDGATATGYGLDKSGAKATPSPSPKRQKCNHCHIALSSRAELRAHIQTHHRDQLPAYQCKDCNYSSAEQKNYERHLLRHLLAGPFQCPICSFSSTSQNSIKRHVALQHTAGNTASDNKHISHIGLKSPPSPGNSAVSSKFSMVSEFSPLLGNSSVNSKSVEELHTNSEFPISRGNSNVSGKVSETSNAVSEFSLTLDNSAGDSKDSDNSLSENLSQLTNSVSTDQLSVTLSHHDTEDHDPPGCLNSDVSPPKHNAAVEKPDTGKIPREFPQISSEAESVIEVEVRVCENATGAGAETWWTCLACGARYNERAKVRRHVKCKHRIALSACRLLDYRTNQSTDTDNSGLRSKLQLARAATTNKDQTFGKPSCRKSEIKPVTNTSVIESRVTLQCKSFVKIAPKPLEVAGNSATLPQTTSVTRQHVTDDVTSKLPKARAVGTTTGTGQSSNAATSEIKAVFTSRQQVVLPKRSWSQLSISTLAQVSPSTTAVLTASSALTHSHAVKQDASTLLSVSAVVKSDSVTNSSVISESVANDTAIFVSQEGPKKKRRRLVLRPKPSVTSASCVDAVTVTDDSAADLSAQTAAETCPPAQHAYSMELKAQLTGGKEPSAEMMMDGISEENGEQLKKTCERKRASLLKCAHCQFTANRLPDLRRHLLEHTGDQLYNCDLCSRTFRNKIGLYLHEQRKHKVTSIDQPSQSGPDSGTAAEAGTTPDGADGKKVKDEPCIDEVKREPVDPLEPEVGNTNPAGTSEDPVTAPMENKNKQKKDLSQSGGRKRCNETVEVVQSADDANHFKIVIRRKSSIGNEILETIDGVNNGTMCRFCGYTAKIPAQLSQHMKIHTGQRDYWCSIGDCTYRTIWRCDMKRHFTRFHQDEVDRHGGSYHELLQRSYRPSTSTDDAPPEGASDPFSDTIHVLKMTRRQRRRLLKLQNRQKFAQLDVPDDNIPDQTEAKQEDEPVATEGSTDSKEGPSAKLASEERKIQVKPVERYRPYKCSECGRRSNWRWDLKKHIQAMYKSGAHSNAVIIKLNPQVARATYSDFFHASHTGRNGIRFPRQHPAADGTPSADGKTSPGDDGKDKKPMSELEKTLTAATGAPVVKSIGMIDKLHLKRFQCSGCPYRSDHRGDLGRHIRMRHGRGSCSINVLSVDVATATLQAYRQLWNRKKAWLTKGLHSRTTDQRQRGGTAADNTESCDGVPADKLAANSMLDTASYRKHRDLMLVADDEDEMKCCDICPFKTDRTGLLELHKLRHRPPGRNATSSVVTYSCPHCPYYVRTSRQLERHMALHDTRTQSHSTPPTVVEIQPVSRGGLAKNRYICEKCPFTSLIRNEFWLHRRLHLPPQLEVPYACQLCDFWTAERRTMTEHTALHNQTYYPRLNVPATGTPSPTADVCGAKDSASSGGTPAATNSIFDGNDSTSECPRELDPVDVAEDCGMEVGECPELEAVDQLVPTGSDPDLPDCCPLLEPEATVQPSHVSRDSTGFPTLVTESPSVMCLSDQALEFPAGITGAETSSNNIEAVLESEAIVQPSEVSGDSNEFPTLVAESPSVMSLSDQFACGLTGAANSPNSNIDAILEPSETSGDSSKFPTLVAVSPMVTSLSDELQEFPAAETSLTPNIDAVLEPKATVQPSETSGDFSKFPTLVTESPIVTSLSDEPQELPAGITQVETSPMSDVVAVLEPESTVQPSKTSGDSSRFPALVAEFPSVTCLSDELETAKASETCSVDAILEPKSKVQPSENLGNFSRFPTLFAESPIVMCLSNELQEFPTGITGVETSPRNNIDAVLEHEATVQSSEAWGNSSEFRTLVAEPPIVATLSDDLQEFPTGITGADTSPRINIDTRDSAVAEEPHPTSDVSERPTPAVSSDGNSPVAREETGKVRDVLPCSEGSSPVAREEAGKLRDVPCSDGSNPLAREETGKVRDVRCGCGLQCPYCFYSIASVRLLRQHIVFHIAVSDAALTPVFHPDLDALEDGRMDTVQSPHLYVCTRCRQLTGPGNPGTGNPDCVTCDPVCAESESKAKAVFMSLLSLSS